jgi:hypothetical protein
MAEDVHDFLADFDDNALNDLEQRLSAANAQAHGFLNSPHLAPNKKPEPKSDLPIDSSPECKAISPSRPEPVSTPAISEESGEKDFLAELEREVAVRVQDIGAQQGHHAKTQELHKALSRIFAFLHRMSGHANKLQPAITRSYRLDTQIAYEGLHAQDAFADSRKHDLSENSYLSHVNFRMRLVAPQPIGLLRRWDQLDGLKKDLHILNLRLLDEPTFTKKPDQEFIKLALAPDFPLHISFKGNYKAHRIDVSSRNLEGFCVSNFALDIAEVNQDFLDELGRFLLSRSLSLPGALRRVNYVPSAEK